jgi:hypothetical protein
MEIQSTDWLAVIEADYLRSFVPDGGATVKFAVPVEGETGRAALAERLGSLATAADFVVVGVDSRVARLHLIDQLFFHVARQVDWDVLTDAFLRRLFGEHGFRLPEDGRLEVGAIADVNQLDPGELDYQVERLLNDALLRNFTLSYEFRLAMKRLCEAHLRPDSAAGPLAEPLRAWLRGELRAISALRGARIYKKIARHTARHMLFSLARWTRLCGRTGLVLMLDIGRYTEGTRPAEPDGSFYYANSATLDLYEVLRQCIDATDELGNCLLLVLAAPSFLTDDRRGVNRYDALRLRISDEVHDRSRVNPLAALVRIAGAAGRSTDEGARDL